MKLVSAVMPTRGRQRYAQQAVECFLSQTYANKELVILDDFDQPSFLNGVDHPLIRYYQTENIIYNIPTKRNRVNALVNGEIIWHLDSDDYSAPTRMAQQVERLEMTGKALTGYGCLLFVEECTGKVLQYRQQDYACGSSLCYRKEFWQQHPFIENKPTGSDNFLVRAAREAGELDSIEGGTYLIARIHDGNTSRKDGRRRGSHYHSVEDLTGLPLEFFGVGA